MIINNNLAPVTQAVTDIYWKSEVNVARINEIVQYILEREERLAAQLAAAREWIKHNATHSGACGVWDTAIDECTCGYDAMLAERKE